MAQVDRPLFLCPFPLGALPASVCLHQKDLPLFAVFALEAPSWQLAAGSWQLATGKPPLPTYVLICSGPSCNHHDSPSPAIPISSSTRPLSYSSKPSPSTSTSTSTGLALLQGSRVSVLSFPSRRLAVPTPPTPLDTARPPRPKLPRHVCRLKKTTHRLPSPSLRAIFFLQIISNLSSPAFRPTVSLKPASAVAPFFFPSSAAPSSSPTLEHETDYTRQAP